LEGRLLFIQLEQLKKLSKSSAGEKPKQAIYNVLGFI